MATPEKMFTRFTLTQRIAHWVMTISFVTLMVTGLPQRYALSTWAEDIIEGLGGIESVRVIHRIAAVVFMLVMIYHFIDVAYKVYVLRLRPSMMPTFKDVRDLFNSIRYYIGLRENHPRLPRYNFAEKIEYWAVIWGGILMALTGFMLWNPIATTSILPGQFVPAARTAHSAEALLAFLAIIIWHVYWVHLKTFNRAMFTGKLTREQMLMEHAAELEEIEAGNPLPPPPLAAVRQRERIFMPVASVVTVLMLIGLFEFVTFERTAITTVPPGEVAQAFVPATPTPTNTPQPTATPTVTPEGGEASPASIPMISHSVEGREDCLKCHAADGPIPEPASHANYALATCQVCHSIKQENPAPPPIKHKIEGREECSRCHKVDLQPESHQAANFSDQECLVCHSATQ